jgi:hypothetical protein
MLPSRFRDWAYTPLIVHIGTQEQPLTKRHKTIEKPVGRGRIPMTAGKSVNARYALVVTMVVDDEVDTGELAGHLEIRGTIEVDENQGVVDLAGHDFRLQLSDGRCLEAKVKKGDPVTRQWEIVAASSKGLQPC